jgi:hypothetical protein
MLTRPQPRSIQIADLETTYQQKADSLIVSANVEFPTCLWRSICRCEMGLPVRVRGTLNARPM